jgi:hypothetical protein
MIQAQLVTHVRNNLLIGIFADKILNGIGTGEVKKKKHDSHNAPENE